jgi:hypothetical protein
MTNRHGEIDTTSRKTLDQRHSFLECFELPPREFFRDGQAASSMESEVLEGAVGPTVLVALSRRLEQLSCRNGEHEPVARMTLRC